jgi:hypothetical protein
LTNLRNLSRVTGFPIKIAETVSDILEERRARQTDFTARAEGPARPAQSRVRDPLVPRFLAAQTDKALVNDRLVRQNLDFADLIRLDHRRERRGAHNCLVPHAR